MIGNTKKERVVFFGTMGNNSHVLHAECLQQQGLGDAICAGSAWGGESPHNMHIINSCHNPKCITGDRTSVCANKSGSGWIGVLNPPQMDPIVDPPQSFLLPNDKPFACFTFGKDQSFEFGGTVEALVTSLRLLHSASAGAKTNASLFTSKYFTYRTTMMIEVISLTASSSRRVRMCAMDLWWTKSWAMACNSST